jgi:CRISPR-associated DxTHG motif protein
MILLTFLGTGKYELADYTWQDTTCNTKYVIQAIAEFFEVKEIKVFVTKEAEEAHGDPLAKALGDRYKLDYIDIPLVTEEKEIWQLFEKLVESVPPHSEIIFDITHAFRSTPVIVLLASAFLQRAQNVQIKGVYYGQYDRTQPSAPIIDLTPAIKLLDWLTATETFLNTGSSQKLGKLLAQIQIDFFRSGQAGKGTIQPRRLRNFGDSIAKISQNIEFIRPNELLEAAYRLQVSSGSDLREEIDIFAKPFELLIDKIEQDYAQFALENAEQSDQQLIIKKHYLLIKWYVQKDLGTQAILLAREWIVTTLAILENYNYLNKKSRESIETQLKAICGYNLENVKYYDQSISKHVKDTKTLDDIWSQLGNYRNDIAHCEMRVQSLSIQRLYEYAQELPSLLKDLFPTLTEILSA